MSRPLEACRSFALGLPEAWEDQPWEESLVAKVGQKIFVFFGPPEQPGISVKLPDSADHALSLAAGAPTGYGLGRHRWVSLDLAARDCPDTEVLFDWVEESYRTVAPKRLVTQLDTP